jgi:hypothetical protein
MTELARRYVVMPLATDAPFDPADPDGAFVLKPWKDPAALRALRAYRDSCFPELRRDLDAWIQTIESGPAVRGDIGRRNEPFARAASVPSPPAVKGTARGRGKRVPSEARPPSVVKVKPAPSTSPAAPRPKDARAPRGSRAPAPRKPARKRRR